MRAIRSLLLICMMATVVAACGGGNSNDEVTSEKENVATPEHEHVATPDNTNEEATDEDPTGSPNEAVEPSKPDSNGKLAATIDIKLEVEGNVETRTGTLAVSDNGYYLYTLPQFKFTPEEPNADQVYMDKYEDFYMRIITLGAEPNLTEVRANSEVELAMLGEVNELTGEQIWESALRDSKFYLHSSDESLNKYIIVREIDGKYFKIIVNVPNGEAQEGAGPSFPAMIKTMELTRP